MRQVLTTVPPAGSTLLISHLRSFGRRERLLKHMKSHGIGVMPTGVRPQPQYQQPKKEFKKEPEFNAGKVGLIPPNSSLSDFVSDVDFLDPNPQTSQMTHGVFGDQTNQLLRMIAQKGPLSPEQLGMGHPAPPTEQSSPTRRWPELYQTRTS